MANRYRLLSDADVRGKRVLLRAGFDVPMENGVVTDATRIETLVPTMRWILDNGASLILMAHQGRPKDAPDPQFSQKPLVPVLEKLLKAKVLFASSCVGPEAKAMADKLNAGEVLLLENLRFDPREKKNDPAFAKELASLGDVYVNDAFTNCHRKHASMVGVPALLPAYMGLQLAAEVTHLEPILHDPKRPVTLVISGAKMETKIPVIRNFLQGNNDILTGGCIANTFLAATGADVGGSKHEKEFIEECKKLLAESAGKAHIHIPQDVVIAAKPDAPVQRDVPVGKIPAGMAIYDLGSATAKAYADVIARSGTVVWNGPLGMYESPVFAESSKTVAAAIAKTVKQGSMAVIGGGDTLDFHARNHLPTDVYTFASTGGGAMLEFLAGEPFSALDALKA